MMMLRSWKFFILISFLLWPMGPLLAQGTPIKYNWAQNYYGQLKGESALLFAREMNASKLAFADIDGDGDQDLFMGQINGELAFFENRGTAVKPNFVLVTQEYKGIFEQRRKGKKVKILNKIDVGERSAPALVDIDFDGDFDLFIGSGDGKLWFFENIGNNLIPVFKLITTKFEDIEIGKNLTPIFADVNLARKFDLIIGNEEGQVWLFYNSGTRKKPDFTSRKPVKIAEFGLETHAVPSLVDWDDDQDLDLIVGKKNGSLSLFLNKGDRFYPDWQAEDHSFQLIDIGGESAPVFIDMDQDGDQDLVIGSANPTVSLFINRKQGDHHLLWNSSNNLFNFNKLLVTGSRGSIAVGDIDTDGDLDLVVGEESGNLNLFLNISKTQEPNWELQTEELLYMTGMENSAPTLGDLDGDGDLDLLVGEKQGTIAYIENIGTPKEPRWALKNKTYFNIDVGSNSVPRLFDYDGDGDLDLFIGNFTGRLIYYQNKGTKKEPLFQLESTRFASAKISKNSVPAFFDWNQDGKADLILGDSEGNLTLFLAPPGNDNLNWTKDDKALGSFHLDNLSHPIFTDFNGDKVPDFLIGNNAGDFVLYLNQGIEGETVAQQVVVDNSIDQKGGSLMVEQVEGPVELDIDEAAGEEFDETAEDFTAPTAETTLASNQPADPKWDPVAVPLIKNKEIRHSVPTFGDLDQDGDLDLLIGCARGHIFFYQNQGTDKAPDFQLQDKDFLKTGHLRNTAPLLVDLDQDGDLDLLVGDKDGRLHLYLNQGTAENPNFVLDTEQLQRIWLGANARPSVLDLNNDSIQDILVGNLWGKLTYIENESSRFAVIRRDYQGVDIGIGSSPSFVDLNNDGILELMMGTDKGDIKFYRNEKKDFTGPWTLLDNYGGPLTPPKGSAPTAVDLDMDGDKELITGSDVGIVFWFRNKAVDKEEATSETTPEHVENVEE